MTDKELKAKILAEIESELSLIAKDNLYDEGRWNELNHFKLFINSLPEEHPYKTGDKVWYLNELYTLEDDGKHYILTAVRDKVTVSVVHLDYGDEDYKLLPYEEPVNNDLEQAIDTYLATYFGGEKEKQDWPFLKKMAIYFANWQKEQFEKNRLVACNKQTEEEAEIEFNFVMSIIENEHRQPTFDDAIKYGMRLQKKQMMKDATGAIVAVDAGGYPYVDKHIELYDYDKDIPLAKAGEKYKVVLIKEE